MKYHSVILASASPRRAALLAQIGVPFTAIPSALEEVVPEGLSPAETAIHLAIQKASDVARHVADAEKGAGNTAVLGADTVVVLGRQLLGKPRDARDAARTLRLLSGHVHSVITGVALVWLSNGETESWAEETRVAFRELHETEIAAYVATGRPLDKAGAYGIQEDAAAFVSRIEGCYFNVVGLPLSRLSERLLIG